MMAKPIYKKYGMTWDEWTMLDEAARTKLTGQMWVTLPCEVCQKPVTVLATAEPGENKAWCMAHAGSWATNNPNGETVS